MTIASTHIQPVDLFKRFGLEAPPESVVQLTRLVVQEASADDIAKVVLKDKAITARLLRFANPGATSAEDYNFTTIDEALMRTGMAPVILLAMLDPLTRAVVKATGMFQMPMVPTPLEQLTPISGPHVFATVEFSGKAAGIVHIRLTPHSAQRLASAVIGNESWALEDVAQIDDVIGELVNIAAGNLQSNLRDAGIACKLTTPQISRVTNFQKRTTAGGVSERLGFSGADVTVFVDVSINPWSE